jgi:hypothetical protein
LCAPVMAIALTGAHDRGNAVALCGFASVERIGARRSTIAAEIAISPWCSPHRRSVPRCPAGVD